MEMIQNAESSTMRSDEEIVIRCVKLVTCTAGNRRRNYELGEEINKEEVR
jgi:ferritin-like protein